jgi:hypothetical protein
MTPTASHAPLTWPLAARRPAPCTHLDTFPLRHPGANRPSCRPAQPVETAIEQVETAEARAQVEQLLHMRYLDRGYRSPGLPAPAEGQASTHITLGLREGAIWLATLTVAWGHRAPLSCALRFPEVVQQLQSEGHALCEFMRLAARNDARSGSSAAPGTTLSLQEAADATAGLRRLIPLFHSAVRAALAPGCTLALLEVNPRHVGFYRRLAGGRVLAGPRSHDGVGAPAVLMALDLRQLLPRLHTG